MKKNINSIYREKENIFYKGCAPQTPTSSHWSPQVSTLTSFLSSYEVGKQPQFMLSKRINDKKKNKS